MTRECPKNSSEYAVSAEAAAYIGDALMELACSAASAVLNAGNSRI